MASITVRNLPDATKHTLRVRAAERGLSLEACVRQILQEAGAAEPVERMSIVEAANKYFGPLGGVDLELPSRKSHREIPDFSEDNL
jgi:plasmid stability protein